MSNQLCGAQISQGEVETYPSIRTSDIGIHDRRHSGRIGRGSSLFIVASFLALNAARTERAAIALLPWNRFESFCAYLSPTSVRLDRGRFDRFMRFGFRSVQNRFSAMLHGAPRAHVLSAQPRSLQARALRRRQHVMHAAHGDVGVEVLVGITVLDDVIGCAGRSRRIFRACRRGRSGGKSTSTISAPARSCRRRTS